MDVRKWSVRKIRRRTRSCDYSKKQKNQNMLKTNASNDDLTKKDSNAKTEENSSIRDKKRNSILLFGSDLEKQPLSGSLDLSSDQDSTGGEEEDENLGNNIFENFFFVTCCCCS